MIAAALIVFRETLEAAMFVGIIAAATKHLAGRTRWLGAGVALGALGALVLALMAERIAGWFDGIGQDLVNIGILSLALLMLVWHCVWVSTHGKAMAADAYRLGSAINQGDRKPWALLVAVALAVLREGAETVLFVGGSVTSASTSVSSSVLLSCALGLAAGAVAGLLIYSGLSFIPARRLFSTTNALIGVLAASIASQLAKALAQAGLIEHWTMPLWDSSRYLSPDSALGAFLHALLGYDARPSGAQLSFYLAVLAFIYLGSRLALRAQHLPPRPAAQPGSA